MADAPVKNGRSSNAGKSAQNEYLNNREVKIYKHRQFEIVEVEKEKIDNIKNAVDDAKTGIAKGSISSDVFLGFSTAFFGGFLGCIPSIVSFDKEKDSILLLIFYLALFLVAVILFVIYLGIQQNHRTTANLLIDKIKKETDSISNSWVVPSNEVPESTPTNDWITLKQ